MPSAPFLVPPLLLAVLLTVSGAAKLRHAGDTRSVMQKLKLPRFLFTIRAPRLLPWGELLVAALLLLLPGRAYVVAATLTLLLFTAYVVVVARALTFDYLILCGCFGRLGLGWITKQTLARNCLLLAVAVVLFADSWRAQGVLTRLRGLDSSGWAWLAGTTVAMLVTALVVREGRPPWDRRPGRSHDTDDTYTPRPIPYAYLDGPTGPVLMRKLSDAAARLLVFWDPRLDDSDAIVERLPSWQQRLSPVQVHLVSRSDWSAARDLYPDLAGDLLGDPENEARARLNLGSGPGAVLLGTDGLLAGGPAMGLEEIEELVDAAAEEIEASMAAVDREPAVQQPQ